MKERMNGIRGMISNICFFLTYAFGVNKVLFIYKVPSILIHIIEPFIPIVFLRLILNEITIGKDTGRVVGYILGLASVTFAAKLAHSILNRFIDGQMELTVKGIKNCLGESFMHIDYEKAESPKVRNFVQSAEQNMNFGEILSNIETVITAFVTLCGLFMLILTVQPILFFFVAIVVAVQLHTDQKNLKLWDKWDPVFSMTFRKIGYYSRVMKDLDFGKEVRINNLQDWIYHKADDVSDQYLKEATTLNVDIQKNDVLATLAMVLQEGVVYLVLAYKVVFQGMSIGDYSMYMSSINTFANNVSIILATVSNLAKSGLLMKNFRTCIELADEYNVSKNEESNKAGMIFNNGNLMDDVVIEFCNVSFRYPGTDRFVLNDITLTMKKGESLSIVGLNGAGKTTFVKLLCRLYKPTSGQIFLNGVDIQQIPYDKYVKLLGVVFQDFKLYAFSIRENVTFGRSNADIDVEECLKKSGVWERVSVLPNGLNTSMTREFDEEGVELSGGQAQKLAIARVLYKNPPIVVLDEPTSALDPIAEHDIYTRFHELIQGKLALYISHRLSSCQFCDKIVVFDGGRIVQYGNHESLVSQEGLYSCMWNMQAQYYIGD